MSDFRFDEATHTYWAGNRQLVGVSQALSLVQSFDGIPPHILARKAEIGKAAHLACQFIDEGDDVDPDTLDPVLVGYVAAWRKFLSEVKPTFDLIEEPLHDLQLGYAGTPDRSGFIEGIRWTIDIKTVAQLHAATALQTAAYENLIRVRRGIDRKEKMRRAAVQLKPDGSYRFQEYTSPADWPTFISLINVTNWRKTHVH